MTDNPFQAAVGGGKPPPSAMDMLSKHDMDSSGRIFLKAPKGPIEALISSIIEDRDAAAAFSAYRAKCVHFHKDSLDGELMQWWLSSLAARRGVNGAGQVLALETMIGAISEITTTSVLGLKGVDDLAKRVKQNRERENKVEKGKVQD